jgi:hypothetical protein
MGEFDISGKKYYKEHGLTLLRRISNLESKLSCFFTKLICFKLLRRLAIMMKSYQKTIALCVTLTFLTLLPVYAQPYPAEPSLDQDKEITANAEPAQNFIEKEQQIGYQASPKNILPVILGIAAVVAGVFLLVILISKDKYDLTGSWDFRHNYTTAGHTDFDSVWTFTAFDSYNKVAGTYSMNVKGVISTGQFTIVNKSEVVFQNDNVTEQYVGQFDSKTTMSGTFVEASGAQGNWTAVKK